MVNAWTRLRAFQLQWSAASALSKKQLAEEAADAVRLDLAKRFNHLYAYTSDPGRWMCPSCNKVHESTNNSVFTGLQYPRCCRHPAGHRQYPESACEPINCTPLPKPPAEFPWRPRDEQGEPMPEPPNLEPFLDDSLVEAAEHCLCQELSGVADAYLDMVRYCRSIRKELM